MKRILFFISILTSLPALSQSDSANTKLAVTIQARDIEFLINYTGVENQFKAMDSVFAKKLSGSSAPSGTTNVSCDSVKAKHWLLIFERIRQDALAVDQGIFNRLKTSLNNTSFGWLTLRVTRSDDVANAYQSDMRQRGRKIARRELEEQ